MSSISPSLHCIMLASFYANDSVGTDWTENCGTNISHFILLAESGGCQANFIQKCCGPWISFQINNTKRDINWLSGFRCEVKPFLEIINNMQCDSQIRPTNESWNDFASFGLFFVRFLSLEVSVQIFVGKKIIFFKKNRIIDSDQFPLLRNANCTEPHSRLFASLRLTTWVVFDGICL